MGTEPPEPRVQHATGDANVTQAVPFLGVADMQRSLRFYVDGLGFRIAQRWEPDGTVRWCRLERGGGALMLQAFWRDGPHANVPAERLGAGVTLCFFCRDALALYGEFRARGVDAARPFVGNGLWVTALEDPDGYRILFESPTEIAEETEYDPHVHG
jgi:catechol 2,3-dioxygenase-like lactoylglutathione lyase family enzyme